MTEFLNYHGFDPDGVAESEADHFGTSTSTTPRLKNTKVRRSPMRQKPATYALQPQLEPVEVLKRNPELTCRRSR